MLGTIFSQTGFPRIGVAPFVQYTDHFHVRISNGIDHMVGKRLDFGRTDAVLLDSEQVGMGFQQEQDFTCRRQKIAAQYLPLAGIVQSRFLDVRFGNRVDCRL